MEKDEDIAINLDSILNFFSRKNLILIFFAIIFLLGFMLYYKQYDYTIQHDYPRMANSADANSRISEAESSVYYGSPQTLGPWFDDDKKNIISPMPPVNNVLASLTSVGSGIAVYDLLYFYPVLSLIGVSVIIFFIFLKVFKSIWAGYISGLLVLFPAEKHFQYLLTLGMWPHVTELVFSMLVLLFLLLFYVHKDKRYLIALAIFFPISFYTHSSLPILMFGFLFLFFIINIMLKHFKISDLVLFVVISILLILPYTPILYANWFKEWGGSKTGISLTDTINFGNAFKNQQQGHQVQFYNFITPILIILLLIGIIASFAIKNKGYWLLSAIFLYFFIIIFLLPFIGINHGQVNDKPRYMIYIFAYPLIALGMYSLIMFFRSQLKVDYKIIFAIICICILGLQLYNFSKIPENTQGLISKNSYDGYVWAKENTAEQSKILCIGCIQFEGIHTHRPTYLPAYETDQSVMQQMLDIAQNNKTNAIMKTEIMGHSDWRIFWNGSKISSYGSRYHNIINRSMCDFDYFIFKDLGSATPLVNAIAQKSIAKNNTIVYAKENFAMIKNNHVKGECI